MTTQLNDYDLVLALSQNTINNQFYLLMAEGLISDKVSVSFGPPDQNLGLNATVGAPTIDMVLNPPNPNQVQFNINLQSGTLTYLDYTQTSPRQTADVSGWVLTLIVSLNQMTLNSTSPAGLAVSQPAQSALTPYVGDQAFTVQALFLDLANVNLSTASITADDVQMTATDTRYPFVLSAIQQVLLSVRTSGNPYILGFYASSNNPTQTNPQLPALAPTRVQFLANQYNYPNGPRGSGPSDDGLSSLCYLAMVGSDPFPYPNGKEPAFVWNQIPSAQVQGRMFIDGNAFNSGYIHSLVLPVLTEALLGGGPGNWSQTGQTWTLDSKTDNGNQNSGHGPVVGSDSGIENIYGKTSLETYCTLALDVAGSTNNQVIYNGSGYFFQQLDLYEDPFIPGWVHDAWTNTKLPFTFTLTLMAGADGTIQVKFVPTEGASVQDHWENFALKISDALSGLFTASLADQLSALSSAWATFETTEFSQFTTAAQQGFTALSQQLILPAPQQFYYSNIGLNQENDILLDIGFKS